MSQGFLHLNLHSDRSQFVGLIRPNEIVSWCKSYGLQAAAITDHDNISVAIEFYDECNRQGIKPIIGMEVSICDDKKKKERGYRNLILLAKNKVGFKNLVILATLGSMYFYYKPRIEFLDLKKYGEGLIVTTGCLSGVGAAAFFTKKQEGLKQMFDEYYGVFNDDFYVEFQPSLSEAQRVYNEALKVFAESDSRCKLLVSGDPHYLNLSDQEFHQAFMRVRFAIKDRDDWKYPFKGPYHVRNRDEMDEQFGELHGYDINAIQVMRDAFDRPLEIADKVEAFSMRDGVKVPRYI